MPIETKVDTRLFPLTGWTTDPTTPDGRILLRGDLEPRLSWLAGLLGTGSVIIEGTSGGSLKVADTGSGLESYEAFNGTATDTNVELNITSVSSRITIEVMTFDMTISLQNSVGTWGGDIDLAVGVWEWDFTFSDVRLKNETGGSNATYQIVTWS